MTTDVRGRGRETRSEVLRELLLLWDEARRADGRAVTQKRLARIGGISPSTLHGWLSGRSVPREADRLAAVAGELARVSGRPVRRSAYWSALLEADRSRARIPRQQTGRPSGEPGPGVTCPSVRRPTALRGTAVVRAADGTGRWVRSTVATGTGGGTRRGTGGGPLPAGARLVNRYRTAPPAARAVVDAALDAVRLGHRPVLPAALLAASAPHYLTSRERNALRPGWVADGLEYLREAVPGTGALLTAGDPAAAKAAAARAPRGAVTSRGVGAARTTGGPEVRIAEALVRRLRPEREGRTVPAGLWESLARYAHPADRSALARSAAVRGLTRIAVGLCASAAEAGDLAALSVGAALLAEAGRTAEAADWYAAAADRGVPEAALRAAELLERDGRFEQAVDWYDRAALAGSTDARFRGAELLGRSGGIAPALHRFEEAARAGHRAARHQAGRLLAELGRADEALEWFARAADDGHPEAAVDCARICAAAGRIDRAAAWWERAWAQGAVAVVPEAAGTLEAAGRIDEAAAWYERAATCGDETAWHEAAALFARHGQYGNLPWYAHIGDPQALRDRAERCERDGDPDGALDWYRKAAEAGSETALFQAADLLERQGDSTGAVHWYERAAARGDAYAMRELGRLLGELGRSRESVGWYRAAAAAGDRHALLAVAHPAVAHLNAAHLSAAHFDAAHPAAVRPGTAALAPGLEPRASQVAGRPTAGPAPAAAPTGRTGPVTLDEAVELLVQAGRPFEAGLLRGHDGTEPERLREASRMLSRSTCEDRAIAWVQRLADAGDGRAVREAAEMLESRGRIDDALTWYGRAAAEGDRDALLAGARMLAERRRPQQAEEWYRRAADAGDPLAHRESLMLLQEYGAPSEAVGTATPAPATAALTAAPSGAAPGHSPRVPRQPGTRARTEP
ncbi:SEL1-like repeat protein [Kitasatospora sp. NA04385]|uniref:SEL1-like repeat protein n=1 Tax=Kitasatospora sp. NA04385 TaxID=2742135 RepID=UPI0015905EE3|nr:SEL1-like repeat protein [Kitasatospora sp. NA04385]QKW19484.1 SEL1-like repeat protein [Kitasatospora sp. NA04385]